MTATAALSWGILGLIFKRRLKLLSITFTVYLIPTNTRKNRKIDVHKGKARTTSKKTKAKQKQRKARKTRTTCKNDLESNEHQGNPAGKPRPSEGVTGTTSKTKECQGMIGDMGMRNDM